jgi:hypothetical protein
VNPLLAEVDMPQFGSSTGVRFQRKRKGSLVVDLNNSRLREFETRLLNRVAERERVSRS